MDKFYITTPIYYVNAAPHIGHTYTTIASDVVKRYKSLQGFDARLTTGTDEHGQKIERSARNAGKTPEEFTDTIAREFRETWEKFQFGIDYFQRTTSPSHAAKVQELYRRCKDNGYIYKSSYTGYYSVVQEAFIADAKPGDVDPENGQPLELVTEENCFFRLSNFTEWLIELNSDPEFLQPESRRNEVLAFLKQEGGLKDLSISRTTIKWGIPVPDEPEHVFYVWFDALMTYMSAVEGTDLWPADLHMIGKEIVRFHAIYWPAFLKAAGWPLPKKIFAHGWLLFDNNKMSKSRGNIVRPEPIRQAMGADALRYYLLREIVFGSDGNFAYDAMVTRYNADLANGLGNLASRTLSMIHQYRAGTVLSQPVSASPLPVSQTISAAIEGYEKLDFSRALEAIWALIGAADKYIVEQAPWKLVKNPDAGEQLDDVLATAADALRIATVLAYPVMPDSCSRLWKLMGFADGIEQQRLGALEEAPEQSTRTIPPVEPVFPRLDLKTTIDKMNDLEQEEAARQGVLLGKTAPAPAIDGAAVAPQPLAPEITIDDFVKVDLRVGEVKFAEKVKGADKLLHLKVDIGEPEPRTIVAGIAAAYDPEKLLGRKVVIVANLAPRKLRGIESRGMIVAASLEGGKPTLAGFLEEIPVGARLK